MDSMQARQGIVACSTAGLYCSYPECGWRLDDSKKKEWVRLAPTDSNEQLEIEDDKEYVIALESWIDDGDGVTPHLVSLHRSTAGAIAAANRLRAVRIEEGYKHENESWGMILRFQEIME